MSHLHRKWPTSPPYLTDIVMLFAFIPVFIKISVGGLCCEETADRYLVDCTWPVLSLICNHSPVSMEVGGCIHLRAEQTYHYLLQQARRGGRRVPTPPRRSTGTNHYRYAISLIQFGEKTPLILYFVSSWGRCKQLRPHEESCNKKVFEEFSSTKNSRHKRATHWEEKCWEEKFRYNHEKWCSDGWNVNQGWYRLEISDDLWNISLKWRWEFD